MQSHVTANLNARPTGQTGPSMYLGLNLTNESPDNSDKSLDQPYILLTHSWEGNKSFGKFGVFKIHAFWTSNKGHVIMFGLICTLQPLPCPMLAPLLLLAPCTPCCTPWGPLDHSLGAAHIAPSRRDHEELKPGAIAVPLVSQYLVSLYSIVGKIVT